MRGLPIHYHSIYHRPPTRRALYNQSLETDPTHDTATRVRCVAFASKPLTKINPSRARFPLRQACLVVIFEVCPGVSQVCPKNRACLVCPGVPPPYRGEPRDTLTLRRGFRCQVCPKLNDVEFPRPKSAAAKKLLPNQNFS
jgi:hypothetical protein